MKRIIITIVSVVCPMIIMYQLLSKKIYRLQKNMNGRFSIQGKLTELALKEMGVVGGGTDGTNDSD